MKKKLKIKDYKIAVIGLGYVGLPLAVEFGKKFSVIGYDFDKNRIENLKKFIDLNNEISKLEFKKSNKLFFTNNLTDLSSQNCYIITVPTPINSKKKPDLKLLIKATKDVGSILKKGDLVIYESTVYPGLTEEVCVPLLEEKSKLKFNLDFFCGYSPERINPGDKKHRLKNIKKVTSGSTPEIANLVDFLYNQIITAGTFKAKSIRVAEAAKVIENTQRDINIALINELSIIFNRMNLDTEAILQAASSKWNFLKFTPGLVGGHCIGVDPYYLTYKSKQIGYTPRVILAGRRLNDYMGVYVASQIINLIKKNKNTIKNSRVLILGITFKENCPDFRNSRVIDIINQLKKKGISVKIYDPCVNFIEVKNQLKINLLKNLKDEKNKFDCILLAVAHKQFFKLGINNLRGFLKSKGAIYDLKYILKSNESDLRL